MKKILLLFIFLLLVETAIAQLLQISGEQEQVKDRDGNVYQSVKIGEQIWMAENLKVTRYRDGTPIANIPDHDAWSKLRTGAMCCYENDPSSCQGVYGALYNYHAVTDSRGLCPPGWHVPTIDEWRLLEKYLGGGDAAGGRMKDIASNLWKVIHPGANNASGFAGVPAGGRGRLGSFGESGYYATWWSSTSSGADFAWHWGLCPDRPDTRSNPGHKASGFSIRCIKDN